MDLEFNVVVVEICLHLLAVQIEHIEVSHGETAAPSFVTVGEVGLRCIEDTVNEGKVVFNLFIPFDVEAIGGLGNRGFEVRHVL